MGAIADSLKNKDYKKVYLIYGDEAYMRNYYKNSLRLSLTSPDDNLNYSYFEGTKADPDEIASLTETMPFMAEYRVVIVENSGFFSKGSDASDGDEEAGASGKEKVLIDAITNMPDNVILIFSEEKVDKRSKLYKKVSKEGISEEFKIAGDEKSVANLVRWCVNYVKNEGSEMSYDAASYFVSEVGHEMTLLKNELDKLLSYTLDKKVITVNDIDEISTHQITGKVFDMITAITEHRQRDALRLYYDLLALRESPFMILSLLSRQYTQLLTVKDLNDRGYSVQMIADKTGIRDWLVKKMTGVVRKLTVSDIIDALSACEEADWSIKSGNMTDVMSVEVLIVSCSNLSR